MRVWQCMHTAQSSKGEFSTEPAIDQDGKGILIAGWYSRAHKLFGCHIVPGANDLLGLLSVGCACHHGYTEIGEQETAIFCQQHILWLDVAVDDVLIVGIL